LFEVHSIPFGISGANTFFLRYHAVLVTRPARPVEQPPPRSVRKEVIGRNCKDAVIGANTDISVDDSAHQKTVLELMEQRR
jgi:hypothetical protein